jgi:hypothetical protein
VQAVMQQTRPATSQKKCQSPGNGSPGGVVSSHRRNPPANCYLHPPRLARSFALPRKNGQAARKDDRPATRVIAPRPGWVTNMVGKGPRFAFLDRFALDFSSRAHRKTECANREIRSDTRYLRSRAVTCLASCLLCPLLTLQQRLLSFRGPGDFPVRARSLSCACPDFCTSSTWFPP